MIKIGLKAFKLLQFTFSFIFNFFINKKSETKSFFSTVSDLLKSSNKTTLIQKLSGDQHVNIILKKTIESIIKEDIHHKDRKNARKRSMFMHKKEKKRKHFMLLISFFGLSICLLILGFISNVSSEVICIISTAAGIFGSCLKDAYVFEFGSRNDKGSGHLD